MPYNTYEYNMSANAVEAYNSGEKPKSAWTKKAMLNEIEEFMISRCLQLNIDIIESMSKENIFSLFFTWSSWHHTGYMYKKTEFYKLDSAFVQTLTNDKLYALYTEQRKHKNSSVKQLPRFVEARYVDYIYTKSSTRKLPCDKVSRGYIKGEWFTALDGTRKNINGAGFKVLKEIDSEEAYPGLRGVI